MINQHVANQLGAFNIIIADVEEVTLCHTYFTAFHNGEVKQFRYSPSINGGGSVLVLSPSGNYNHLLAVN